MEPRFPDHVFQCLPVFLGNREDEEILGVFHADTLIVLQQIPDKRLIFCEELRPYALICSSRSNPAETE